jgi:hypothetical protein
MHHDALDFVDAHPPQIDLAGDLHVGNVAAHGDGNLWRGSLDVRTSERAARNRQLHYSDGDDSFTIAHLENATDLASQGFDFHEISDAHLSIIICAARRFGGALETIQLAPLLVRQLLDALSCVSRRFLPGLGCSLELANGALDIGARFEKISPGFLS